MNRESLVNENEIVPHDDNIENVIKDLSAPKESKVCIWDADSIVHFVLYSGKDELGNKNPEYEEKDLEMLQGKLTEMVLKTLNSVEKYYNVVALYIFVKGKYNFRKKLYPSYKANRLTPNPLIGKLYDYFKVAHQTIESNNAEAEDYCYSISKKIDHNGIILSIDHDVDEIPTIIYNYKKDTWKRISPEQARMNKIKKLIVGESGDNVNLSKGLGIKHFEKFYNSSMTDKEIEAQLLKSYIKVHKTEEKAKEMLELAKKMVWLQDVESDQFKQMINGSSV